MLGKKVDIINDMLLIEGTLHQNIFFAEIHCRYQDKLKSKRKPNSENGKWLKIRPIDFGTLHFLREQAVLALCYMNPKLFIVLK